MALVVTNTLTGRREPFVPLEGRRVRMYVCGLTPYDSAHIGHGRTYVAFDVIRRWLERSGYQVQHIQNITDVEDKILARAHEVGESPLTLATRFWEQAEAEFGRLRILPAQRYPRVSEYIPQIIAMIERLIANKHAYPGKDAEGMSVYFDVASFRDYGSLSHLRREEMLEGVRKDPTEGKRDTADFALWKAAKPGEISWDSPWGKGRPGWHIECSAMSTELLGPTLDIHGGGRDLAFPHHENELAQSEGATGHKPFVRYWMHTGFLTVSGEKMSKSLGNFVTVADILSRWRPEAVRLWLVGTHYRSPIDYSESALEQATKNLERIENMLENVGFAEGRTSTDPKGAALADERLRAAAVDAEHKFAHAMDDDFNTPVALAVLFDFVGALNRAVTEGATPQELATARRTFTRLAEVLAIIPAPTASPPSAPQEAELLALLMEVREAARKRKAFDVADLVRDRLASLGYVIQDTAEGPRWSRKK
ncbi:MAG: cysteine--tRNA ligase [Thermoplasmatota archaeon]